MRREEWTPVGVAELEPAAENAVRGRGSTLIVAGPGAGKTELLAQRACYLLQCGVCSDPTGILAISFKRDAARNLKERVRLRCGDSLARRFDSYTFDAFAKGLIDRFWRALPATFQPLPDYEVAFKPDEKSIRDHVTAIPSSHCRLNTAQCHSLHQGRLWDAFINRPLPSSGAWENGTHEETAAEDLWRYILQGDARSRVIFPMLGRLAELLLRTNPAILEALRSSYGYVFLDEFQDTTRVQYALIRRAFLGSSAELTAVGDKKQRIMGWAGAMQKAFDYFTRDFEATTLALERNYRSSAELVRIQQVVAQSIDADTGVAKSMVPGTELGECRVLAFEDDDHETSSVARLVKDWLVKEGLRPRDICILCRMKTALYTKKLQEALTAEGINSRVEDAMQDLLAEPLCEALLDILKLSTRDADPQAWMRTLSLVGNLRGGSSERELRISVDEIVAFTGELSGRLSGGDLDPAEVLEHLREVMTFLGEDAYRAMHPQYLQGDWYDRLLDQLADALAQAKQGVSWSDAIDIVEGVNCVPMMTMHKSKGLEYHTVIFLGLEDDAFWNYRKNKVEETCGMFVGLSRAMRRTVFTFSGFRATGRDGSRKVQSRRNIAPFYELLEKAGIHVES